MGIKDYMFIYKLLGKENVILNADLRNYTSFKIGGKAEIMLFPATKKQLVRLLKYFTKRKLDYVILGKATNVLICKDIEIVISMEKMNKISLKNGLVYAEAGVSLFTFENYLCEKELTGLEKLYGIPGSVGGGIVQNCGAYGCSISDNLLYATIFDGKKVKKISKNKLQFSYRNSIFKIKKQWTIIGALFKLSKASKEEIEKKQNEILSLRKSKQPYEYPSAGSVFKRIDGVIISKLIDELGLKGTRIGGAKISEKHAGFIINFNNATSGDVINLINFVKNKIKMEKNIDLETEIVII